MSLALALSEMPESPSPLQALAATSKQDSEAQALTDPRRKTSPHQWNEVHMSKPLASFG